MTRDVDVNVARETCDALMALNKKVGECARLGILVEMMPTHNGRGLVTGYTVEFTRTERIVPFKTGDDANEK